MDSSPCLKNHHISTLSDAPIRLFFFFFTPAPQTSWVHHCMQEILDSGHSYTWQSNITSGLCSLHFALINSKGIIHPKIKNTHFPTFLAVLFIELNCFSLSCRVFGDIGPKNDVCLFSNLMEVGLWHPACQRKYFWKKEKMNSYVSGKNYTIFDFGVNCLFQCLPVVLCLSHHTWWVITARTAPNTKLFFCAVRILKQKSIFFRERN